GVLVNHFLFGRALLYILMAPPETNTAVKPVVTVRVVPNPVYSDRVGSLLRVDCDFELTNSSDKEYEVGDVRAKAFAADGTLLVWNKVDSNGTRPSIEVV